jgi:2-methylcitrate dehydratase PrpD
MAYDSLEALRAAGFLSGAPNPAVEEVLRSLTEEETEFLISLKSNLKAAMPEVQAHSQEWSTPEAAQQGLDAAMLCQCGIWSGSGLN